MRPITRIENLIPQDVLHSICVVLSRYDWSYGRNDIPSETVQDNIFNEEINNNNYNGVPHFHQPWYSSLLETNDMDNFRDFVVHYVMQQLIKKMQDSPITFSEDSNELDLKVLDVHLNARTSSQTGAFHTDHIAYDNNVENYTLNIFIAPNSLLDGGLEFENDLIQFTAGDAVLFKSNLKHKVQPFEWQGLRLTLSMFLEFSRTKKGTE